VFENNIELGWLKSRGLASSFPRRLKLKELDNVVLNDYLRSSLWPEARPANFGKLVGSRIGAYQNLYNTVDGLLIPLLVKLGLMTQYSFVDTFVRKILFELINDYATTISILKTAKKVFKKNFAEGKPLLGGIPSLLLDYFGIAQALIKGAESGPE